MSFKRSQQVKHLLKPEKHAVMEKGVGAEEQLLASASECGDG